MFTVMKWITQEGLPAIFRFLMWAAAGAIMGSFIAYIIGPHRVFYLPGLLVQIGLGKFWAGLILGGLVGTFIINVLIATWPKDFEYPAVPLGGSLGMILGEAFGFFLVLGHVDKSLGAGIAFGFFIVMGVIMDVWIAAKGIKSGLPEEK